ncbi:MAG: hypothetical protein COV70_03660 [Parcubacteria group bacterium CG11_big_fil_rev_8_21_14_0_20_39_22]|nr:MAG: hypothetical protein COV70_03660 [Parcubacteria group bacterium CG11_big_fil_rev_8_21_14_0_20_39_22]
MENSNKEKPKTSTEVRDRSIGYVTAALSLVAGLAWNDAVKALIEYVYPLKANNVTAKFVYAFLITIVVVILTMVIAKVLRRGDK